MPSLAIVPAAGRAERFGGGKLTADLDGEPLLNRTLRSLLEGGLDRVVVVLAPGAAMTGVALLNDPRVRAVVNPDPSRGMFSSIQCGVAAEDGDPMLVLPGDMPFVNSETIAAVLAAAQEARTIVSPRLAGRHGHPVALPSRLKQLILDADVATTTLSLLIAAHGAGRVELDVSDKGVRRDVDVRGDLAR